MRMGKVMHQFDRNCEVCGSDEGILLFQQHFSASPINKFMDGYNVVACNSCGFCYADQIPDQSEFDRYYQKMSKYEYLERSGSVPQEDLARFQDIEKIIHDHFPNPQVRILEIGCSTGVLMNLVKQNGFDNVSGIDPSPACSKIAHELYGIKVLTDTFSNIILSEQSVDLIILIGVLEHVRDLNIALQKCYKMLSSYGQIFISVPDASRYSECIDAPYQEFSLEHINYFGPISLSNLMIRNGFSETFLEQNIITHKNTLTPAIHSIFKKSNPRNRISFNPDIRTSADLQTYIQQSQDEDNRTLDIIDRIVSSDKSIIVWGTGSHTLRLLATSNLGKARIKAFIDSNPHYQGKVISGIKVISPSDLINLTEPILISSRQYQEEIVFQIRKRLKLNNEIITLY